MILEKLSEIPTPAWIGFGINAILFILCCVFAILFWTGGSKGERNRKENKSTKTAYHYTKANSLNKTYGNSRYRSSYGDGCRREHSGGINYSNGRESSEKTCTSNIGGYVHSPVQGGCIFNNGISATEDSSGNLYFSNGEFATRNSNGYYYFSDGKSGHEDSSGNIHLDDGQVIIRK